MVSTIKSRVHKVAIAGVTASALALVVAGFGGGNASETPTDSTTGQVVTQAEVDGQSYLKIKLQDIHFP